ncbi:MAG: hypothetical protein GY856_07605 [bacterium]|nr:hypothetical protein [bacterium]
MDEVLTMSEIETRFDSEWILVGDPETNELLSPPFTPKSLVLPRHLPESLIENYAVLSDEMPTYGMNGWYFRPGLPAHYPTNISAAAVRTGVSPALFCADAGGTPALPAFTLLTRAKKQGQVCWLPRVVGFQAPIIAPVIFPKPGPGARSLATPRFPPFQSYFRSHVREAA